MDNLNIYKHAPLIEECRKGNSKAQFRLYNQYSKAMYNLAYRILNNREDAEDILQEAFVECFKNLGSFRFESTSKSQYSRAKEKLRNILIPN